MKDNIEMVHFHIKRRGVQGHVFVPITFENCTLNFYFENDEFDIKKTIANLQPLLAWSASACLRMKHVFMKLAEFFISSTKRIFTKLLKVSESSIKIKVGSHLPFFLF